MIQTDKLVQFYCAQYKTFAKKKHKNDTGNRSLSEADAAAFQGTAGYPFSEDKTAAAGELSPSAP